MTEITYPTCEELYDGKGFESVHRSTDDSWRHGCYVCQVFLRDSDNTYWMASYCLSNDGETNELRSGDAEISHVMPVIRTVTEYVSYKP